MDIDNNQTGFEIAIIGMSGRFPGANNLEQFWENLKNGVESIEFFSTGELIQYGIDPKLVDQTNYVKAKGVLAHIEYFDPLFFDYSPKEAEIMDPQLRILHECAFEALEDAAYDPGSYKGLIGVYIGGESSFPWNNEIMNRGSAEDQLLGKYINSSQYFATRLAYRLNLKGPCYTIQTACSTSLVAIHLACQALLSGECHMALAGGISITLPAVTGYLSHEGMIYSPDGHCRPFDAKAKGTIFSDGVGVILLKPLEQAIAHRDNVYAVIKGTALNNDGADKVGFNAPGIKGQTNVVQTVLAVSKVQPESIDYIETSGTGTPLGDQIEMEALTRVFNTPKRHRCRIGSVKSNIGHLFIAAGMAGLTKTVLALKHRLIPPTLHFQQPHPDIDFNNCPFSVNKELYEWTANRFPLRALVHTYGIGGTNASAVLEEAPPIEKVSTGRAWHLILLSAKTETALQAKTTQLLHYLKKNKETNLEDIAYTLQVGRRAFPYRKIMVCSDMDTAIDRLSASNLTENLPGFLVEKADPPVIFTFPQQESLDKNVGRELYQTEPTFAEEMDRCFEILKSLTGYDMREVFDSSGLSSKASEEKGEKIKIFPSPDKETRTPGSEDNRLVKGFQPWGMNSFEMTQMVSFCFEYALAKLLMSWGIIPYALMGYGSGEYVAACISGIFSLRDALKLAVVRTGRKQIMNPSIGNQYEKQIKQIQLNKPQVPCISSISGSWLTVEEAADPRYWLNHLNQSSRSSVYLPDLLPKEAIIVEIGPDKGLSSHVKTQPQGQRTIYLMKSSQEDVSELYCLLKGIGQLWLYGKTMDGHAWFRGQKRHRINLPTYPFERQRYWLNTNTPKQPRGTLAKKSSPVRENIRQEEATENITTTRTYVAPQTKKEEIVAGIWAEVLKIENPGIDDSLFDLGGKSLDIAEISKRLTGTFDIKIPVLAIFEHPTIKSLARFISKQEPKEEIEQVLSTTGNKLKQRKAKLQDLSN